MEDLPSLFPGEEPTGEPLQPSHEQLTVVAEYTAAAIDSVDQQLAAAVAAGAITEERATALRDEAVRSFQQSLQTMEAGRFVPDPHTEEKVRMGLLDIALGSLEMFDRVAEAATAVGDVTEEEVAARRQELVERNMRAIDGLGDS